MSDCSSQKNRLQQGDSPKRVCIVTGTHGDELEGQYVCFRLNQIIRAQLERLNGTVEIYPALNPLGIDSITRGIPTFDLNMNRIFPGDPQGAMPEQIKGYTYGIQLASFYISGDFVPHVRLMRTGYEDTEGAKLFGMPYITLRQPLPFDTTLLNYNWQIWETQAFSLYTHETERVDPADARQAVDAILRFLAAQGLSRQKVLAPAVPPVLFREGELHSVISAAGGLLLPVRWPGDRVRPGDVLGEIVDPCTCTVLETLRVDCSGQVFFLHHAQLISGHEVAFRILPEG